MPTARANPTAGLGDPYWYEWSVGQGYVIDMLAADSDITSVTLQQSGTKGLDDVVVAFANGDLRLIQVKHSRAEDTFTFGDLVSVNGDDDTLLRQMANAWEAQRDRTNGTVQAWLVTNRAAGSTRARTKGDASLVRPPLADFLLHLRAQLKSAATLTDLEVPAEWRDAWELEWLPQLASLASDERKIQFMRLLEIRASEDGLDAIAARLVNKLEQLFGVARSVAERFMARLDAALRRWATSARGSLEGITRERAYQELCLVEDELVGEHDLSPPAPFFDTRLPVVEDIAALVQTRATAVVFLAGEPGSGKTAVLSALANRREPVIDLRYHAYRPITPENQLLPADAGRTTTSRALWSDLLIQLRGLVSGRLSKLQVPAHCGSLTVEKLRSHVLRLANTLGEERGRPVVIAIDGIDHAARAGSAPNLLLESLIPPGQVPPNIVFLIGGQPPESYANYPGWLRIPTQGVKRFDLPRLTLDDTLTLVLARLCGASDIDLQNVARDVWKHCEGHTLATVFAVEEAALSTTGVSQLSRLLDERRISSGIEEYYRTIWNAAIDTHRLSASTATRLAACFALSPSRVKGAIVRAVVPSEAGGGAEWQDVLRCLRPLLVEERDGFRVFHNDVRVFLAGQVQAEPEIYRDCASRIADHLIADADPQPRHAVAQHLYGIARRPDAQASMFTPSYVLEGHAAARSLEELTEQALVAAHALGSVEPDWDLAHQVATGLRTLEQLRSCLDWRKVGPDAARAGIGVAPTRLAERAVRLQREWSHEVLTGVLSDLQHLWAQGESARAKETFRRWFGGLSPAAILAVVASNSSGTQADFQRQESEEELGTRLGDLSLALGHYLPPDENATLVKRAEAYYARGILSRLGDCTSLLSFGRACRRVTRFFPQDVETLLTQLVVARAWDRACLLLGGLCASGKQSWPSRILHAAVSVLVRTTGSASTWTETVMKERVEAVSAACSFSARSDGDMDVLNVMAWLAFLFGHEEPNRDVSAIRAEIEAAYCATNRDDRKDGAVVQVLHAAALLGSLVRAIQDGRGLPVHAAPSIVARTVSVLMETATGRAPRPHGFAVVAEMLVRGFADCAARVPELAPPIREIFLEAMGNGRADGAFLEVVWMTLLRAGYGAELRAYAELWLGPAGRAWKLAPGDRHELVTRVNALLESAGEEELAAKARSRLAWAAIGYTERKETVLRQPLEWFRELAKVAPLSWKVEGLRLYALSREASRTGDNRLSEQVDGQVVAAACLDGPYALARIVRAPATVLAPGDDTVITGILGMVDCGALGRGDLLSVWSFCTGHLCWQVDRHRNLLARARESIIAAADRAHISGIALEMESSAPAEFACERDQDDAPSAPGDEHSSLEAMDVAEAMRAATSSGHSRQWEHVARVLDRVVRERPFNASITIDIAWASLSARPEQWWFFDGAGPAYRSIFPLLTKSQRWKAVVRAVTQEPPGSPEHWTSVLAENLDDLCRLAAPHEGEAAIRRGLDRLLAMHEEWSSGAGRIPAVEPIPLGAEKPVLGWSTLFVEMLLDLLTFDDQAYLQAALRGIYRLSVLDPVALSGAAELLYFADAEVQRRFLMIAEPLAALAGASDLRAWLETMVHSPQLDLALSAHAALRFARRVLGEPAPMWPAPEEPTGVILPVAAPLLERTGVRKGLHITAGRPSTTVLQQVQEACLADVADVQAYFASSVRDDPPLADDAPRVRLAQGGDMVTPRDAEMRRLMETMRALERRGRFVHVPVERLAQALVPAVDPFVLLETPRQCPDSEGWPVDDTLESQLAQSSTAHARLAELLTADLDASRCLIAGAIRTFSRHWDVAVLVDHVVSVGNPPPGDGRPWVLGGRSSLAYDPSPNLIAIRGTKGQQWLTQSVGGLFPFVDATLDFFPGRAWNQLLGWEPEPRNPLVWVRGGRRVAWFERRKGPARRLFPSDLLHRQPMFGRWVCTKEEWTRIIDTLGFPLRRTRHQTAKFEIG